MTTPEIEPLGSARRALELANFADECAASLNELLGDLSSTTVVAYRELAKLARHYAELSQKWQAMLDAEPLGILVNVPGSYLVTWDEQAMLKSYQGTCQLITKPAP